MSRPVDCYLGIGSNLGNRQRNLETGLRLVSQAIGKLSAKSPIYESPPWGSFAGQSYPYLNAVVLLRTRLDALEVLEELLSIEAAVGRQRTVKNAPRTLDLDLLFFGRQVISSETLSVPHPRIVERRFVLQPLADLDRQLIHPVLGLSIAELLQRCTDPSQLKRFA